MRLTLIIIITVDDDLGNLPGILRPDTVAEVEFSWFKEHGTALRIKGAFGVSFHGSRDSTLTQFSVIARYIVYSRSKGASDVDVPSHGFDFEPRRRSNIS